MYANIFGVHVCGRHKTPCMYILSNMQEAAIQVAQDAIRDNNLEKDIANAVKAAFEGLYPSL